MRYILDIIFAAVFALCIFTGYKRGFVKSLTDLVSNLIAVLAARVLSVRLAPQIFSAYFEENVALTIKEKIAPLSGSITQQAQEALSVIPEGFLSVAGIDKSEVISNLSEQVNSGGADVADALMTNIFLPIGTFILRIIIFVIAFVLCLLIMKLISLILNKLAKLPVLKQANKAFGFVFGAVKGIIIVAVLCIICQIAAGFIGNETFVNAVSSSLLVSTFGKIAGSVTF